MQEEHNYIVWNKKFETGIITIDAQHRKLVRIINRLHSTLMNRTDFDIDKDASLKLILNEAIQYTKTHFSLEEQLMKTVNYPGFAQHKKEHEAFILKIIETGKSTKADSVRSYFSFVKFLSDWVLSHIANTDMLYAKDVLNYYKKM
ncbi:MAG: bacteriohemerythrin [Spirochaetales bacterium]